MVNDLLNVGQLVGGLGQIADPYFYTDQEKARDANQMAITAAQQNAIDQAAAVAREKERTNQQAIQYALAGVLGVSCVFLASRMIGK